MNILIVEDEKPAADKIKLMLSKLDDKIVVVGVLETVQNAINWFSQNPSPDLILMDIQLDDGICFEIFSEVNIKTPVIFTTAYDEYALRAFKVNSIDYLLKPIDQDQLQAAITKYKSIYKDENLTQTSEKINHIYKELVKPYKTRFFVKLGMHYYSICTEAIDCFFVRERGTFIRTDAGKTYDVDFSLEQIQNMVDPQHFFRINRNLIINITAIEDIHIYSTSRLKLKLKHNNFADELIVSRDNVPGFKKWMDR